MVVRRYITQKQWKDEGDLIAIMLKNGFYVAVWRISTGTDEYMHGQTEHTHL